MNTPAMLRSGALVLVLLAFFCFVPRQSAASKTLFSKGERLYKAYQFEKAIQPLQAAFSALPRIPRELREKASVYLAICYYNQAKPKTAALWYREALKLNPDAKLPKEQAPQVYKFFANIRSSWLQKNSPRRRPPPRRRDTKPLTRRKTPTKRRVATKRRTPPAPKQPQQSFWQRHLTSLIIGGTGVAVLLAGAGVGLVYIGKNDQYQQFLKEKEKHQGQTIYEAYQAAYPSGLAATILLASGGGLLLAGSVVFILESLSRPKATPPPPTNSSSNTLHFHFP